MSEVLTVPGLDYLRNLLDTLCIYEPSPGSATQLVAAAVKSLQSCPTLCNPIDSSPPGSPVPGSLQARTLEWLPFPSPMHACMLSRFSRVRLCEILWTAAHQAPPSTGFSRQEHWSGLPFPHNWWSPVQKRKSRLGPRVGTAASSPGARCPRPSGAVGGLGCASRGWRAAPPVSPDVQVSGLPAPCLGSLSPSSSPFR